MTFLLDLLNISKFLSLARFPRAMSLDAPDVEAISRVRTGDDSCDCLLVFRSRGSKKRDINAYQIYLRVRCDLTRFGLAKLHKATNVGLIIGHCE